MAIKRYNKRVILICGLVFSISIAFSQTVKEEYNKFDANYGYNPQIFKGAKYMVEHRQDFGHPYFLKEQAFAGSVMADKYKLDSVQLWYDIYKDYLVYGYVNHIGSQQKIILNAQEIERFSLGRTVFIKNTFNNISTQYVQEIYANTVSCIASYRKEYKHVNNNSKKGFGYTDQVRKLYLVYNGNAIHVSSINSLTNILPIEIQQEVKQFMTKNAIKPLKASEKSLIQLFEFINNQLP